jgi:hypothetical protein
LPYAVAGSGKEDLQSTVASLFLDLTLKLLAPQVVRETLRDLTLEALLFVAYAARPGEFDPRVAFEAERDLPAGTLTFGALFVPLRVFFAGFVFRGRLLGGVVLRLLAPAATGSEDDPSQ